MSVAAQPRALTARVDTSVHAPLPVVLGNSSTWAMIGGTSLGPSDVLTQEASVSGRQQRRRRKADSMTEDEKAAHTKEESAKRQARRVAAKAKAAKGAATNDEGEGPMEVE